MQLIGQNLSKVYKRREIVKNVSLEVNQGEIVGLLGPNGEGKTTCFYMIVGLIRPTEGKIFLGEKNITLTSMYKRAQKGVGYLAQEPSIFRKLSVEDNISSLLEMTRSSREEQKIKTKQILQEFNLKHIYKNSGDILSGGERRRTEIARLVAINPKFLILDEPFAGIDPISIEEIQKIIALLKKKNIGILITDHNVQDTLAITDRTYLMFEGNILKHGTAEELV